MSDRTDPALQRLGRIAREDAEAQARREANRTLGEARRVVLEAQDHVAELTGAAKRLGQTRGGAAIEAVEREADAEIAAVHAQAGAGLEARFLRRLRLGLEALRKEPAQHEHALGHWAGLAASTMGGVPCEVHCARRDRQRVYELLREAGATDFQVRGDPRVQVGFVVRDLDGRTRYDARPEGRIAAAHDELLTLLRQQVAAFEAPERRD